ncbi:hypothetical protein Pla163_05850 [Planctomycetes bacterium Pla163]|uniref:DUF58 domain-containing protein n=1 Tax=Rohdeia mirabilis TaxID=2528008 RepID=A0A518CW82_9BACT|nr:hypothetical protein Pla163_05850 [Planctomycetes bacterium Pla163]
MRPTSRILLVVLALALGGLVVAFFPSLEPAWFAVAGLGAVVAVLDASRRDWRTQLVVEREVADGLPLDAWSDVTLVLENPHSALATVEVFDGVPGTFDCEHLPRVVELEPQARSRVTYRVRPRRRGRVRFDRAHVLRRSPLGLWTVNQRAGATSDVLVLPNYRPIVRYALLAVANRLEQMGIRKKPRRGLGKSFHQLREYREGDLLQQIDWKATARRSELISREFQEERDQQVVFLLDCGQRMRSVDGATPHFDHCLNAMLLLSYVALRQGDSVSVLTFAGEERWLPPVKGANGVRAVLDRIFDLEPTDAPSDYAEAARRVLALQRKRSLVVWLTNLRGEDASEVLPAVATLRARHVSLVASLREARVDELLEAERDDVDAATTAGAAAAYAEERQAVVAALRSAGARALDLRAPDLPVALANEYLDIKSGGVL